MKEIETKKFQQKKADLIEFPPVPGEQDKAKTRKKKKKKIYQLNKIVDDVSYDV